MIVILYVFRKEKSEYLGGDVYLVGTTNVGKSSIFNQLMDSDLCDLKALCRIDKATIAPVPGTTLNLLKFPIMKPEHSRLARRWNRYVNKLPIFFLISSALTTCLKNLLSKSHIVFSYI